MHAHARRLEDDALLAEVLVGLRETPPRLPAKLFYDEVGSELFERFTIFRHHIFWLHQGAIFIS